MRHNAAIAFTATGDASLYKLSILLKVGFWVVLSAALYGIINFAKQLRSGNVFFKHWCLHFSIYLLLLTAVLLLIYPGHWVWDEFNILEVVKTYTPYAWQNYFTNIYYTFCLFIFPSALSIILTQLFIIALFVGYVANLLWLL
jgi:hypothetical protein